MERKGYYITSLYFDSGIPDDHGIQIIGQAFTFIEARKILIEKMNKINLLYKEDVKNKIFKDRIIIYLEEDFIIIEIYEIK